MDRDWRGWPKTFALVAGLASAGCQSVPSIWSKPDAARAAPATPDPRLTATRPTGEPTSTIPPGATAPNAGAAPPYPSTPYPTTPQPAPHGTTPHTPSSEPATPHVSGYAATTPPPESAAGIPAAWAGKQQQFTIPISDPNAPANRAPDDRSPEETAPVAPGELLEPAKIVGRVGEQVILAGDIDGTVSIILALQLKDVPEEEKAKASKQIEGLRRQIFKQALKNEVNTKLGYIDFMRTVPSDKHGELQKRVKANFEKELEEVRTKLAAADTDEKKTEIVSRNMGLARLAMLMEAYGLDNLGDLDAMLRTLGSSLDKQVRAYGELKLQQMAVMRNIRQNVEITHEQMLEYYHGHLGEYEVPAKARWEQLTVRFDKFPDQAAATAAISEMGNAVYLGGASFAAVAKKSSQEPNAEEGGVHDWTQRGSLASKPMDDAIFSLPTGKLSPIIRDDRGLHIIRVLERTDAGHTSFLDAQTGIKEKIRTERRNKDVQTYFEKVKASIPVWTIEDDVPEPAAR